MMLNAKKCSNLAEREGFEPSVPVTQDARLAIWCLRPLGHLSALPIFLAIPPVCARSLCPVEKSASTIFWQISGIFGRTSPAAANDRSTRSASLRSGLRVQRAQASPQPTNYRRPPGAYEQRL